MQISGKQGITQKLCWVHRTLTKRSMSKCLFTRPLPKRYVGPLGICEMLMKGIGLSGSVVSNMWKGKKKRIICSHFISFWWLVGSVAKLCPTLATPWTAVPIDYSLPGSSVHGILQGRILEWVAISFSRGSSWPRNLTWASCIVSRFFTNPCPIRSRYCFILQGSKITADVDCSHEIKRQLLLGRKAMTNLDSILKSRDITLSAKVCLIKAMFFQQSCMHVRVGL